MKQKVIVELSNGKLTGVHTDAEIEVLVIDYDDLKYSEHHDECDFVVPIESMDTLPEQVRKVLHWTDGEAEREGHCEAGSVD